MRCPQDDVCNSHKLGSPSPSFYKVFREMVENNEELPDFSLGIESFQLYRTQRKYRDTIETLVPAFQPIFIVYTRNYIILHGLLRSRVA